MSSDESGTRGDPVALDDDDDDIPSGDLCQKASEEFATITGTDTALAMFYLQGDFSLFSCDRAMTGL
jgi:hypothetical protein